jgi:plasmid stabilization system protein ParE
MPRGDKSSYTSKQKRRAEHIEEGYENRGVSRREAARRAWATVNKEEGGGKKSGAGRGRKPNRSASRKGGRKGAAARSKASRSAAARKGAATRRRRAKATGGSRKSTGPARARKGSRSSRKSTGSRSRKRR